MNNEWGVFWWIYSKVWRVDYKIETKEQWSWDLKFSAGRKAEEDKFIVSWNYDRYTMEETERYI